MPRINDPEYVDIILKICKENNVKAITTLIDPEIEILANNAERFKAIGVTPLCPAPKSAIYCFNKYELYKYLVEKGIRTPLTFHGRDEFRSALAEGRISFPVFMKPVCGSGSVGAHKVHTIEQAEAD